MSPAGKDLTGHTAIVTGANHGIGGAIAKRLAEAGAAVLCTYLRLDDRDDDAHPEAYRRARARDAEAVVRSIEEHGGRASSVEADLAEDSAAQALFDAAEERLGPVDILVNNASGWVADTFKAVPRDRLGRTLAPLSSATFDQVVSVDARGSALLIAELARRHRERGGRWGRIVGLSSGGPDGFSEEVSYGAAKAALENITMSAAYELADLGITANVVLPPVTDTGWVTPEVVTRSPGAVTCCTSGRPMTSPRSSRSSARTGRGSSPPTSCGCDDGAARRSSPRVPRLRRVVEQDIRGGCDTAENGRRPERVRDRRV